MIRSKKLKHRVARSIEISDMVQLKLIVQGQVRANRQDDKGGCLVTIANASFEIPSFETEGTGPDRKVRRRTRKASWSTDGGNLELICELASTQRVECVGVSKEVRETIKKLSDEELDQLLAEVGRQRKPLPPPPRPTKEPD